MQSIFNQMLADSDDEDSDENNNICLISHENLNENHVVLLCNHKFNYKYIYDEVYSQKYVINHNEIQKLSKFQFKCPYCRRIQNGVLPSHPDFGDTYGINCPQHMVIKTNNCCYKFASGKRKGMPCSKKCHKQYCNHHQKIMDNKKLKDDAKVKCCAITKKGHKCKRYAKSLDGKFCLQHDKNNKVTNKVCSVVTNNVVITI